MPRWKDGFENHPIHESLTAVGTRLSEVKGRDTESIESIERIKDVHRHLSQRVRNIDPNLVAVDTINSIDKHLDTIDEQLIGYMNDLSPQRFTLTNTNADQILILLANMPSLTTPVDIEDVMTAVTSFRTAMTKQIEAYETNISNLQLQYDGLTTTIRNILQDIDIQKKRMDDIIIAFQGQFSEAEANRRTEYDESRKERLSDFQKAIEGFTSKFDDEIHVHEVSALAIRNQATEQADAMLAQMRDHVKTAQKTVHVIGNAAMTTRYKEVADEEKKAATMWRWIAFSAMVGLIIFGFYAYWTSAHSVLTWSGIGAKIFGAVPFGILAAFAARQSEKHRETERQCRRIELELTSIDPYLAALGEAQQHEVKRLLAERLFGQLEHATKDTKEKTFETTGTAADAFKPLFEAIRTFAEHFLKK